MGGSPGAGPGRVRGGHREDGVVIINPTKPMLEQQWLKVQTVACVNMWITPNMTFALQVACVILFSFAFSLNIGPSDIYL